MMLGPTHEELFALTVKGEYNSYKDFPVTCTRCRPSTATRSGPVPASFAAASSS